MFRLYLPCGVSIPRECVLSWTCLCSPLRQKGEAAAGRPAEDGRARSASFRPGTLHLFPTVIRRQRQCCRVSNVGCCASDCLPGSPFLALSIECSPRFLDVFLHVESQAGKRTDSVFIHFPLQDVPDFPDFKRHWGEPRFAEDVSQSLVSTDQLQGRRTSRIPDRRHLLCPGKGPGILGIFPCVLG